MIAKLTGIVDALGPDWVVIDVGGVGYHVTCAAPVLADLAVGRTVSLAIETHMREDRIQLFGFAGSAERDWFRLLQTVQGVGGKVALAILTVLPPEKLVHAIAAQDRAAISRADGVGPKLALRILTELKDKAGGIVLGTGLRAAAAAASDAAGASLAGDAVSALVNLGYGRSEAFGAVASATRALGEAASLDKLIRAGLKELSQ
jgi:Holliday junction DNA helicase RuvA